MSEPGTHHYFVDEAGDLTLFDRRKRPALGREGVSHTFAVGAVLVADPGGLAGRLETLRAQLLADPLLAGVPSMDPRSGKTARFFHAKDDVAEVRREVFRLLMSEDIHAFVAFRRKARLAEDFRAYFNRTGRKRDIEGVYEQLLLPIFKNRLHLSDENRIVFARRGRSDRTQALAGAIRLAKSRFQERWRKDIDRPTTLLSAFPHEHAGLQVADYILWALQRFIERREPRFFDAIRDRFSLIVDVDDTRTHRYGEYYSARNNPLSLERLMPVTEARSE